MGVAGYHAESAEQNLSLEFFALELQLIWQSPNLQKVFQDFETLVQTYYLVNIKLNGVSNWPSLWSYGLAVQRQPSSNG